jgi:UPF0716 protein FxsA
MNPLLIFLLLILGLPTLELFLLIQIGSEIGAIPAVLLVIFTAVVGSLLVRQQGLSTLLKVRQALSKDEVPALELLEGAVLLVGGLLLLIPGFLTDAVGFLCLIPPLRQRFLLRFVSHVRVAGGASSPGGAVSPRVIEGEYRREND